MNILFGIALSLWFVSVVYVVWYHGKTLRTRERDHSQQVADLLDRLAFAQGKPYNLPTRDPVIPPTLDEPGEETPPEEGWQQY
jgi:hypothetical protein